MSTYRQETKMPATAKLFTTGRSQAVRLPKEFRFQGTEVFIRRDLHTGEVVLSAKPASWQEFFALADRAEIPSDFMADREDVPAEERTMF
jgi:antitoxin VapB